jgi:hypothetical protein
MCAVIAPRAVVEAAAAEGEGAAEPELITKGKVEEDAK